MSEGVEQGIPAADRSARILVIDDDEMVLKAMAGMLELWRPHIAVATCHTPTTAVEMARTGSYDVIICDMWMPEVDGLTLLPQLRQAAPHAAVVMLSGALDDAARRKAFAQGAREVLDKPVDRAKVKAVIQDALNS